MRCVVHSFQKDTKQLLYALNIKDGEKKANHTENTFKVIGLFRVEEKSGLTSLK